MAAEERDDKYEVTIRVMIAKVTVEIAGTGPTVEAAHRAAMREFRDVCRRHIDSAIRAALGAESEASEWQAEADALAIAALAGASEETNEL